MFNRRFAPMLSAASALAALAASVLKPAATPQHDPGLDAQQMARIFRSKGPKGHGWGGKRRKLKKYMQDHQRPRRRRS